MASRRTNSSFGAVEGPLPWVQFVVDAGERAGFAQRGFGAIPVLFVAGALRGAIGEFHPEAVEAEIAVDVGQQGDEAGGFGGYLVLGAEDVRVVLGEGAHPHDAVQRAGGLVAVAGAEFGHAHRQVAIAAHAVTEDLDVAGAVHRFEG